MYSMYGYGSRLMPEIRHMTMESHMSRFRIRPRSNRPTTSPAHSKAASLPSSNPSADSPFGALGTASDPDPRPVPAMSLHTCDRCRRNRKRCSRTAPACTNCVAAAVQCSLSVPVASPPPDNDGPRVSSPRVFQTSRQAPDQRATATRLDLSALLDNDSQSTASPPGHTRSPAATLLSPRHQLAAEDGADDEASCSGDAGERRMRKRPRRERADTPGAVSIARSPTTTAQTPRPSATDVDKICVDAFFRDVHRTYPFLSRASVMAAQDKDDAVLQTAKPDLDSRMLYLVMAIGCVTLQRTGFFSRRDAPKFQVPYQEIIAECLGSESIATAQVLLLLALFSLSDPLGMSTALIINTVASQAVRLGLTEREAVAPDYSPADSEGCRRLFWSIYALDRMYAVSVGLPGALNCSGIDVPLPRLTVEEFSSPCRMEHTSTLQVARHIIQLRQLEYAVLHDIHLNPMDQPGRRYDAQTHRRSLRTKIEDWYSNGCLLKSAEKTDDVTIHITIPWLASRYYNLLLLLYYPSRSSLPVSPSELISIARKQTHANMLRFDQRELPPNHVTLARLLMVCSVFVHCFVSQRCLVALFHARDELTSCARMLEAFPARWGPAQKAAANMRQLAALVVAACHSRSSPDPGSAGAWAPTEADKAWVHAIKLSFAEVTTHVFGRRSIYRCHEDWHTSSARHDSFDGSSYIESDAWAEHSHATQVFSLGEPATGITGTNGNFTVLTADEIDVFTNGFPPMDFT